MAIFGERVSVILLLLTTLPLIGNAASTANTTDSFYCDSTYECSDPFTFDSTNSLDEQCSCREGWLRTDTCCLSQWWIVGLAAGAGFVVLLAFIIAVGCCCGYKSDAKKAKSAAKVARHNSNHGGRHNDIELDDDIKSHNHHPAAASTAAMMTFAAKDDANHKPHDSHPGPQQHQAHPVDTHHVTPAHVTPAHATPDHVAPAAHPVAATAAVAAVVHEVKEDKPHHNPTPAVHATPNHYDNHHGSDSPQRPVHQQARSSPQQTHYKYQETKPYNRYQSQPAYQVQTDPYYPANRHPPYGGYPNAARYSEDNDSLETYDDTALPSNGYNNNNGHYNPGPGYYNYGDQNASSNKKHNENSNSSLLKIDSTSQFVINRPSVHF